MLTGSDPKPGRNLRGCIASPLCLDRDFLNDAFWDEREMNRGVTMVASLPAWPIASNHQAHFDWLVPVIIANIIYFDWLICYYRIPPSF